MRLDLAEDIAIVLFHRYELFDWRFEFSYSKLEFGVCNEEKKTIYLSLYLTLLNDLRNVVDTLLHEVSHALVGVIHGHNKIWKAKAIELGASPSHSSTVIRVPGSIVGFCPALCGFRVERYKAPLRRLQYSCWDCGNGKFNKKYKLIWEYVQ